MQRLKGETKRVQGKTRCASGECLRGHNADLYSQGVQALLHNKTSSHFCGVKWTQRIIFHKAFTKSALREASEPLLKHLVHTQRATDPWPARVLACGCIRLGDCLHTVILYKHTTFLLIILLLKSLCCLCVASFRRAIGYIFPLRDYTLNDIVQTCP